jgi:acetolactate synthase-1/2/3 large subunit
VREFLEEADVVLVVGSSLDEADGSRYRFAFEGKLLQVDTDRATIGRLYQVEVGLVGDARTVLEQLLGEMAGAGPRAETGVAARIAERRTQMLAEVQSQRMWQYMDAIERALPQDGFVANDGSRVNSWANSFLRRTRPLTYAVTRNTAALGFAWPAAVGARLAHPERASLAVMGDGGFLFTSFALGTAVQHQIGAVAVVFNDQSYGTIARIQQRQYGREVGAALRNPDFVRLAEAFGAHGQQVETPEQLYEALCMAWEQEGPTVIEVPLEADVGFA